MIPEFTRVVGIVLGLWRQPDHGFYDASCAGIARVAVGQGEAMLHHVLYVASVFRQFQPFKLSVVS